MKYVLDLGCFKIIDIYYYFITPIHEWPYKFMREWTDISQSYKLKIKF